MQAQQAILTFTEAERPLGNSLSKLAVETDRIEGYNEPHAIVIARLSEKLGAMMGMHGSDLTSLKFAALAHDLGERQTKRNYLLRPDALTWEERLDLWRHPILGEQAAAELRLPRHAQLLIRWHQEWWNGQGYPDGLAGEAIPLGARILRAVDSYHALTCKRPYRDAYDPQEAEQMLADLAGLEFDPLVVKYLLTALVDERKSREIEFERTMPSFALPPPAEWSAPVVPLLAPVQPPAYPPLNDDPLEPDPLEPDSTQQHAMPPPHEEPLSELLAEFPETSAQQSASPAAGWEDSWNGSASALPPRPEPVELNPIDPETPMAETTPAPEQTKQNNEN